MRNHLKFVLYFSMYIISGCISIGVAQKPEAAKNLIFAAPSEPFFDHTSKTGDRVWISRKTGNSISYLSDCSANTDPSLELLESESLSGIENLEILESHFREFNHRKAKETLASGTLDGVTIKMNVISLKKNSCTYTLLFAGKKEHFDSEISFFNQFKESFKAP